VTDGGMRSWECVSIDTHLHAFKKKSLSMCMHVISYHSSPQAMRSPLYHTLLTLHHVAATTNCCDNDNKLPPLPTASTLQYTVQLRSIITCMQTIPKFPSTVHSAHGFISTNPHHYQLLRQ
jgi:hypothetical protein